MDIGRDKVWFPMREFQGRDSNGNNVSKEVYRNIKTGEVHHPVDKEGRELGWNGEPPPVEGLEVPIASETYRKNYDLINWGRGREKGDGDAQEKQDRGTQANISGAH